MGCVISVNTNDLTAWSNSNKSSSKKSKTSSKHSAKKKFSDSSKKSARESKRQRDQLRDRRQGSTISLDLDEIDVYVDRLGDRPQLDDELLEEIAKRQRSAVRAKVIKYDQLHAMSRCPPPLLEIRKGPLSHDSEIYERVQSFEVAEREAKVALGPPIEEVQSRRDFNKPRGPPKSQLQPPNVYSL